MTNLSKFILSLLALVALTSTGCKITPSEENCIPFTIDDSDYFKTDQTLTNRCAKGVDYIIKNGSVYDFLSVKGNLVIEAGTTIEFENNGGLAIEDGGSIRSLGTAGAPVTLRAGEGATGDWRGIIVYSDNSTNTLQYTTISGGGSDAFNSNGELGNLVLYADAKIGINNCTFQNSASYGVNANYESLDLLTFENNIIQNNQTAMRLRPSFVHKITPSNQFPTNINNYMHLMVGNAIDADRTWQTLSIPYRLKSSSNGIFPDQEVTDGATLTLEPGFTLEFEANTGIRIRNNAALRAVGTSTKPIVLTGASGVAGFWDGLYFDRTNNPLNQLTHVVINYAGGDSNIGAIAMWGRPNLGLSNVTLKNISGGCAIYDGNGLNGGAVTNPNYSATNVIFENVSSQYCD